MQRQNISGADIKPCDWQIGGINAEKCIAYLRGIGVEIDDQTADSWLDVQGTHRFLQSEKRPQITIQRHTCGCGIMEGFSLKRRGQRTKRRRDGQEPPRCEECGTGFIVSILWYIVNRDGSIEDWRPAGDRFAPFDYGFLEGKP